MLIRVILAPSLALVLCAQTNPPDLFERRIRPVLAEKCWQCHASSAKISFAGLKLDSREGFMKGSDAGSIVTPGNPAESRLLRALQYDGQVKMPPTGKLPAGVIADFRTWIEQGAAWPADAPRASGAAAAQKAADHWAWKPVVRAGPPGVRDTAWPSDPLDRFVLAKLEQRGLRPAVPANPQEWLRRVTLDLTGLPPSTAEQEQFAAAPAATRNADTVDRLLGSAAFGQRWARHWLDQTYYADNIEIGRRVPARHAWRYRDYVINAFNRDLPYDRFIQEQLAGDQLEWTQPAERRDNLVATGFLALGPWPLVNADKEQLRMDVVDMQVDMVGRTMLGLTMGCARCHDHKFDPITLRDYYGMAGVFTSTRTLSGRLNLGVFSNVNAVVLPELPDEMVRRAEETREYWSQLSEARAVLEDLRAKRKALEKDSPEAQDLDKKAAEASQRVQLYEYLPPGPPVAHAVQDQDSPAHCRINIRGNAHQLGGETPRSGVAIAADPKLDIQDFTSGRKELAQWIVRKDNPLTARVMANRAWHHLFGAGIVPTIDNFGTRGAAPSHPELLDYLASEFAAGGWSVKKLVRRIVLSRTYGQSGAVNALAAREDPENRMLWRMSRRRLEAETIRDSMLAVSGMLDSRAGGPALPLMIPGNVNLGKPEFLKEEATLDPKARYRRSVYLPVVRKGQMAELDGLDLFNFPDVNQITGARQSTTIPTQALYLMNAPFVKEQATALAKLILAGEMSDENRIRALVRRVWARDLKPGEADALLGYLRSAASDRIEAWTRLCHSLLISNEFLYRS
ncbi:MAG: DUF1553 domain-containing protein [Acidobacteria bacterium]|nr:DUF1553 domain-containing protein [Acidobacteriota bacterium]